MQKSAHVLVALGANLALDGLAPAETLRRALVALVGQGFEVIEQSRLFLTPCYPPGAGPDYVNAAAILSPGRHPGGPNDLASIMAGFHAVEAQFGRERTQRWGMRTLDIDLLAMGDSVLPDGVAQDHWRNLAADAQIRTTPDQLILPHPRLQDRAFVLVPVAEIAPDWVHPRTGLSVRQMLEALPKADRDAVKPL